VLTWLDRAGPSGNGPAVLPDADERKRVTIDAGGENVAVLRFNGRTVELSGMSRTFFLHLLWGENKVVSFEEIWKLHFEERAGHGYRSDHRGAPPARLRKIKSELDLALRRQFGKPPGRRFWVERVKRQGYRLNRASVIWHTVNDFQDRFRLFTLDPRRADSGLRT
jgi:hypothetical protein